MLTPSPEFDTELQVREFDVCDYEPVWQQMSDYTQNRKPESPDQVWYLQHYPVYTLGLNGKHEHVLNRNDIPLVQVDRGGQVTYHGPGQLVVYFMIDMKRKQLGIKQMVRLMEQAVIDYLNELGITAERKDGAPGIYISGAKIAALGLRVKKGCTYHGLSLNVDMDLTPFSGINPCGYQDMPVTQIKDLLKTNGPANAPDIEAVKRRLHHFICQHLRYNCVPL